MLSRLQRSWDLALACMQLLLADKSLLVFPLMSGVAMTAIVATFAVPVLAAEQVGPVEVISRSAALYVLIVMVALLAGIVLVLTQTALEGTYAAALYRYADGDRATGGVDQALLRDAFKPKA